MAQGILRKPPQHAVKTAQQKKAPASPKKHTPTPQGWLKSLKKALKKAKKTYSDFYKAAGKEAVDAVKRGKKRATTAVKEAFESKPAKTTNKARSKGQWDKPDVIGPNPTSNLGKRKKHIQNIMKKLEQPRRQRKK